MKSPSSRRRSHRAGVHELNLVPIMDTMVTLIGFLLFTTSFLIFVKIESILPLAPPPDKQSPAHKPLQLTLHLKAQGLELLSPFGGITPHTIPHQGRVADTKSLHEAILETKKHFPQESTIIFLPEKGISYDMLIACMDAVRVFAETDTAIILPNAQGVDETLKELFPKIVFGNLFGDEA